MFHIYIAIVYFSLILAQIHRVSRQIQVGMLGVNEGIQFRIF